MDIQGVAGETLFSLPQYLKDFLLLPRHIVYWYEFILTCQQISVPLLGTDLNGFYNFYIHIYYLFIIYIFI